MPDFYEGIFGPDVSQILRYRPYITAIGDDMPNTVPPEPSSPIVLNDMFSAEIRLTAPETPASTPEPVCVHCNSRTEDSCSVCDLCPTCCDCVQCPGRWAESCAATVRAVCPACGYCDACCECYDCETCPARVQENDWCSVCSQCNECCDCFYCAGCDERHSEGTPVCACGNCYDCCDCPDEDEDEALNGIRPYNANVINYCPFYGTPENGLYLGVELEVEFGESPSRLPTVLKWADLLMGRGILKQDGSLSDGFEIVTSPWSLVEHQAFWPDALREGRAGLRSWNTSTCGMHVHVSRDPLDVYTIGKVQVFINSPATRKYICQIAGRNSDRWAKFVEKNLVDIQTYNHDRYEAINLQNRATIEFRIFKGTLESTHVLANVEFVDAVCQWALVTSGQYCEDWNNFITYARGMGEKYSHFLSYMNNGGE